MKRVWLFTFILILIARIIMVNCKEESKLKETNVLFNLLKSKTQTEIRQILGKPIGELSGFWGDIYHLDNDLTMILYYGEDGKTEQIKIINKEETITIN